MTVERMLELEPKDIFKTFCQYCQRIDLFDMLNDPLVIANAATGALLFVNVKARELYGLKPGEDDQKFADIFAGGESSLRDSLDTIIAAGDRGVLFPAVHRRLDGELLKVQVSARAMRLHGVEVVVLLLRDLTPDAEVSGELAIAGRIQRGFLPPDIDGGPAEMRSVYRPHRHVSGDLYGYEWDKDKNVLYGYIIDVMGHGLATALQTSALRVLFHQAVTMDTPLAEKLKWINQESLGYFAEDSFAAAILFSFDFSHNLLTYAAAGINQIVTMRKGIYNIHKAPGSYLGLAREIETDQAELSLAPGDVLVFLSDGLSEILPSATEDYPASFSELHDMLHKLANSDQRRDDATALCFKVV